MNFRVKQFPIFHRYLAAILIEVGLAEGTYCHIMEIVGEYYVDDYCHCGDPLCSTVKMSSESLVGKDGAFANPFNIAWIIINFSPDGRMEVESLADREECNFPFRDEIRAVLKGEKSGYSADYAEEVVDTFMKKLVKQEAQRIEVS